MTDLFANSVFFAVFLTIGSFAAGRALQSKWNFPLFNPILIGAVLTSIVLVVLNIPIEEYQQDCAPLQYLLTPATICYAISLYEQLERLKKQLPAILAGVFLGTLTSLVSIRILCAAFGLDSVMTVSVLPKSITTAIGMVLSGDAGGIIALTTASIVVTGILGSVFGPVLCKLFRITDDIAMGVAFGTASHAIGTNRVTEISQLAGAVSSLSLTFAGLITAVLFSFFI